MELDKIIQSEGGHGDPPSDFNQCGAYREEEHRGQMSSVLPQKSQSSKAPTEPHRDGTTVEVKMEQREDLKIALSSSSPVPVSLKIIFFWELEMTVCLSMRHVSTICPAHAHARLHGRVAAGVRKRSVEQRSDGAASPAAEEREHVCNSSQESEDGHQIVPRVRPT
ncbi:hypothetical protein STEG23_030845, partial [Scotinomys teguina]